MGLTPDEYSSAAVIRWISRCRTTSALKQLWTEQLTDDSRALPGVETVKDARKEVLSGSHINSKE